MSTYGQFCPVAKTADVLCQRWAILVVRELLSGSRRFGDIQKGIPACPPASLSKRLRELELAGVIRRAHDSAGAYELTDAGLELYPIVEGFGKWGQRWARSTYSPDELDSDVLMWDVRRFLDPNGFGFQPLVIQFDLLSESRRRSYWAVVEGESVDLCLVDPARDVDAVIEADLKSLTQIWMGDIEFAHAMDRGSIVMRGPSQILRRVPTWFGRHPILADVPRAVERSDVKRATPSIETL